MLFFKSRFTFLELNNLVVYLSFYFNKVKLLTLLSISLIIYISIQFLLDYSEVKRKSVSFDCLCIFWMFHSSAQTTKPIVMNIYFYIYLVKSSCPFKITNRHFQFNCLYVYMIMMMILYDITAVFYETFLIWSTRSNGPYVRPYVTLPDHCDGNIS